MSGDEPNKQRRYFLIGATSAVAGVGIVGAAIPFVASWVPSAKARAIGAPVKIDFSRLKPGEMLGPIPAWRGQPIFVVYRTPEILGFLESEREHLRDPDSEVLSQQPDYAANTFRSRKPEFGVYVGICTHLGCVPKYHGEVQPEPFQDDWKGGFFCPCHGSKFDMAARVYKAVPAPTNLVVPPYSYLSDTEIIIGVDEENA